MECDAMKFGAGVPTFWRKLGVPGTLVPAYWTTWYFIPQN